MSGAKEEFDYSEGWEERLREKLQIELPNGSYTFVGGPRIPTLITGKGGAINMEIALRKELLKLKDHE